MLLDNKLTHAHFFPSFELCLSAALHVKYHKAFTKWYQNIKTHRTESAHESSKSKVILSLATHPTFCDLAQ